MGVKCHSAEWGDPGDHQASLVGDHGGHGVATAVMETRRDYVVMAVS